VEMTCAQLGGLIAEIAYTKRTRRSSIRKRLSELKSNFPDTDKATLLRESFLFEVFTDFQGMMSHFKGSEEGCRILDAFHLRCADMLTKARIFEDTSSFLELYKARLDTYSTALADERPIAGPGDEMKPNPLYWLSKTFCQLCGDRLDIAVMMGQTAYFVYAAKASKELVEDLLKSTRIVG
jgi:hypothetical protein